MSTPAESTDVQLYKQTEAQAQLACLERIEALLMQLVAMNKALVALLPQGQSMGHGG